MVLSSMSNELHYIFVFMDNEKCIFKITSLFIFSKLQLKNYSTFCGWWTTVDIFCEKYEVSNSFSNWAVK